MKNLLSITTKLNNKMRILTVIDSNSHEAVSAINLDDIVSYERVKGYQCRIYLRNAPSMVIPIEPESLHRAIVSEGCDFSCDGLYLYVERRTPLSVCCECANFCCRPGTDDEGDCDWADGLTPMKRNKVACPKFMPRSLSRLYVEG